MKVLSCLNPQVVYNRSLGRSVVVRCGKCEACLNARAANWVQRLDQEMFYSAYTFFVTFQYDEYHVMQFVRLRDEDNPNEVPTYIDSLTGSLISLADVPFTPKDVTFCNETKVLLVPNYSDFQKFLKRLRKKISSIYGKSTKIRYYCTFEVGPTTYRPHAHCLFFFDSSSLAQSFRDLCDSCWQLGCVYDPHVVTGSASQYVASYVNSLTNLPAIYLCSSVRPKSIFSKRPPIGYRALSLESRKELFFNQSQTFTIFKQNSKTFSDVPLWNFLRNSLYGFIVKFGSLSYLDRVALYRLGLSSSEYYFDSLCTSECIRLGYYKYFYTLVRGTKYYRYNEDSFIRFKRIISRAANTAKELGISIEYYVYLISEYYDRQKLDELKEYFIAQNEYFKSHPISEFLLLNRDFCFKTYGKLYSQLEPWQRYYLDLYLPDIDKTKPIKLEYKTSFAFRELNKLHRKIAYDNTKTKQNIDYLMAHSEEFKNIINYKFS